MTISKLSVSASLGWIMLTWLRTDIIFIFTIISNNVFELQIPPSVTFLIICLKMKYLFTKRDAAEILNQNLH